MSDEDVIGQAVEPEDEKLVNFYGDIIPVARLANGRLYAALRPICDALNLNFSPQRLRVLRDDVMAEDIANITVHGTDGRPRSLMAIPVEHLPIFLYGIDLGRLKSTEATPDLREKLLRYKREVTRYVWQAFSEMVEVPTLPAPATSSAPGSESLTIAEQNLEQAATVYRMAAEMVVVERRLTNNEAGLEALAARHQTVADWLRGFALDTRRDFADVRERLDDQDRRLVKVERGQATSGDPVNAAQATHVTQAVKLVADLIEQRTGKRAFGTVYNTLYNRFDIPTYKMLAKSDFEAAMTWLKQWHADEMARQGIDNGPQLGL